MMGNGEFQEAVLPRGPVRPVKRGQPHRTRRRRWRGFLMLMACIFPPGLAQANPWPHFPLPPPWIGQPAPDSAPVPEWGSQWIDGGLGALSHGKEDESGHLAAPLPDGEVIPSPASGDEPLGSIFDDGDRFDILFYGGKFVDVTFRSIVFRQITDYRDSYIWVTALNYKLGALLGPIDIETEAQIAKHTGLQNHFEVNVLVIARREVVLWGAFSISMAFGDGFSLTSEVPRLEQEENPDSTKFLQYLLAELVFGLPAISWHPRLMIRVHHRSGVFGLYCEETCGSNFVTYGIKVEF